MMMRTLHYRSQVHVDHLRSNEWVLPLTMKKITKNHPHPPHPIQHTHTLTDRKTQTPTPPHATHTHTQ